MYRVVRKPLKFGTSLRLAGDIVTKEDIETIPERIRERRIQTLIGVGRLAYAAGNEDVFVQDIIEVPEDEMIIPTQGSVTQIPHPRNKAKKNPSKNKRGRPRKKEVD